ncbi:polyphosphate kinase 2 family protein [Dongia sp.]|uniref:polyphosphate kinase 2 family protein n=1 Tax=Dongia sp. TaxID=1977262 RepID=UPI0035B1D970
MKTPDSRNGKKNGRKGLADHIAPYRVESGKGFRLKDFATAPGNGNAGKAENEELLEACSKELNSLQERLHAEGRWSLLLILQGMDASGKDGAIKNVMSGVDPQGVDVTSFKAPAGMELEHDFMWRCSLAMPRRGRIGIFNRSYYEEVVAVRVYPHFLDGQRLPRQAVGKNIWDERLSDIAAYEDYLGRNGIVLRKILLNISPAEQKKRLLARIEDPDKIWKFSPDDLRDRQRWPDFMNAYEAAIKATASKAAPWFVVPADDKPFARLTVARIAIDALRGLGLAFPTVGPEKAQAAREAAARLVAEAGLGNNSSKKPK